MDAYWHIRLDACTFSRLHVTPASSVTGATSATECQGRSAVREVDIPTDSGSEGDGLAAHGSSDLVEALEDAMSLQVPLVPLPRRSDHSTATRDGVIAVRSPVERAYGSV